MFLRAKKINLGFPLKDAEDFDIFFLFQDNREEDENTLQLFLLIKII